MKIFDLEQKPGQHLVKVVRDHNARITCIKFTSDYKYLISCDADGMILHYGLRSKRQQQGQSQSDQKKNEVFPYSHLYKL